MQTYFLNDFKVNIPKYILPGMDEYLDPANVDFEVRLFVPPSAGAFVATHIGDEYVNCKVADGQICIIADGHQLAPGEVWYEAKYHLPDSDYPDGYCTLVEKSSLGLSLTTSADVEVREEQEASVAEQLREQAEANRVAAETARQTAEAQRVTAETARQSAEAAREQAESNRVAAESQRAETFAGWREAIEGSGSATSPTYTFDRQWEAIGGTVTVPGKVYEINGGTGTFADAVKAMTYYTEQPRVDLSWLCFGKTLKLLPTIIVPNTASVNLSRAFTSTYGLDKVVIRSTLTGGSISVSDMFAAFNSSSVKELDCVLNVSEAKSLWTAFPYSKIEEIRLKNLKENISFPHSKNISLASLSYLVENAANTKAITLTVHADVFAKLTDESNTEWHAVAVAALAKNITIASA